MLAPPKTFHEKFIWQSQHTYPSIFLWDIVKLNLSLLLDSGVLSNLHSSSIFSRESGLLFCKVKKGNRVKQAKWLKAHWSVWYLILAHHRYIGISILSDQNERAKFKNVLKAAFIYIFILALCLVFQPSNSLINLIFQSRNRKRFLPKMMSDQHQPADWQS